MKYEEVRDNFEDGDIVFFHGSSTVLQKLIRWFSGGDVYHVGIAFWATTGTVKKLLIAESQPDGFRIINLSAYKDDGMYVLKSPVKWDSIINEVIDSTGIVPYGFSDFIRIGMKEKFGIDLKFLSSNDEVCSEIVANFLKLGGYSIDDTTISPQKLYSILTSENLQKFTVN